MFKLLLKLEAYKKKIEFLALLILFPEPTQSCSHAFSSDQVSGFENKNKTQTNPQHFPSVAQFNIKFRY